MQSFRTSTTSRSIVTPSYLFTNLRSAAPQCVSASSPIYDIPKEPYCHSARPATSFPSFPSAARKPPYTLLASKHTLLLPASPGTQPPAARPTLPTRDSPSHRQHALYQTPEQHSIASGNMRLKPINTADRPPPPTTCHHEHSITSDNMRLKPINTADRPPPPTTRHHEPTSPTAVPMIIMTRSATYASTYRKWRILHLALCAPLRTSAPSNLQHSPPITSIFFAGISRHLRLTHPTPYTKLSYA